MLPFRFDFDASSPTNSSPPHRHRYRRHLYGLRLGGAGPGADAESVFDAERSFDRDRGSVGENRRIRGAGSFFTGRPWEPILCCSARERASPWLRPRLRGRDRDRTPGAAQAVRLVFRKSPAAGSARSPLWGRRTNRQQRRHPAEAIRLRNSTAWWRCLASRAGGDRGVAAVFLCQPRKRESGCGGAEKARSTAVGVA